MALPPGGLSAAQFGNLGFLYSRHTEKQQPKVTCAGKTAAFGEAPPAGILPHLGCLEKTPLTWLDAYPVQSGSHA